MHKRQPSSSYCENKEDCERELVWSATNDSFVHQSYMDTGDVPNPMMFMVRRFIPFCTVAQFCILCASREGGWHRPGFHTNWLKEKPLDWCQRDLDQVLHVYGSMERWRWWTSVSDICQWLSRGPKTLKETLWVAFKHLKLVYQIFNTKARVNEQKWLHCHW